MAASDRTATGTGARAGAAASLARPQMAAPRVEEAARAAGTSALETRTVPANLLSYVSPARPLDVAPWQKVGSPYQVNGTWYIPAHEPDYDESGTASWYGAEFHGRTTANGELFDMTVPSGAHPTLPIPSYVQVTNLDNGRSAVIRINDRGPFVGGRLIDLSAQGAELLGFRDSGTARVRVQYIGQAGPEDAVTPQTLARLPSTSRAPDARTRPGGPTGGGATNGRQTAANPAGTGSTGTARPAARTRPAQDAPAQRQPQVQSPRTTPPPAGAAAGVFVQVGAFGSRANAERAGRAARELGSVRILDPQETSGGLYRVVVGPFASREAASARLEQAAQAGLPGRVVTVVDQTAR
jgi:rare lipoprotein A